VYGERLGQAQLALLLEIALSALDRADVETRHERPYGLASSRTFTYVGVATSPRGSEWIVTADVHVIGESTIVVETVGGRVAGSVSAPGSHGSGRDSLPSPGSSHQAGGQ
jgi:hypothetical protein